MRSPGNEIGQYGPGLDRGELVAVTEHHQGRAFIHRFEEPAQEDDVDHGCLIDNDEVGRHRVVAVVHEIVARRAVPEQTVQGFALIDRGRVLLAGPSDRMMPRRIESVSFWAARPVGAAILIRRPVRRRAIVLRRVRTMKVFPVPGRRK